jgi:hypothetical protein
MLCHTALKTLGRRKNSQKKNIIPFTNFSYCLVLKSKVWRQASKKIYQTFKIRFKIFLSCSRYTPLLAVGWPLTSYLSPSIKVLSHPAKIASSLKIFPDFPLRFYLSLIHTALCCAFLLLKGLYNLYWGSVWLYIPN